MKRRKSWPHSQVLVEHPEHLHLIKANLSEKVEKEKDQRLVFGPEAQLTSDQSKGTNQHLAAEDILSSLDQWQPGKRTVGIWCDNVHTNVECKGDGQAIIFQNGKVIGRSLTLRLYSCEAVDGDLCSQGLGVESFALQLDSWLPAWKAKSDDSSPLYIAVDERFQASSFHIQLIGRTSQGKNFALPFAYRFDGALAQSRLDYFDSYVRRHQQSRQELLDTSVSSELCVHFDEGLQGFTAIFDVVDQPHWLKSFILRFSVLSASKLDDKVETRSNRSRPKSQETADSMAPNKPSPVESGTHRRQSHHQPEEQVAVNPARDASSLSQASAMGWLPPSLLPPKADTTSKQKQSKKSMKQRASQAGGGREKDLRLAGQPQSSAGNGNSSAVFAIEENGEVGRLSMGTAGNEEDQDMVFAKPVSNAASSQSLGVLHANGMPLRQANGHAAGHCRMLSEDSDASAGSMERSNVGTSTNSHGPSIIADTAVRWSSMNGADGLVRASLANGHGNAKKDSKQIACHILLQEPSRVSMNGFIAEQHAIHGWQSMQDNASARSFDLTTGEDSDCTMNYSSIDSDRSEGTNVSPELASPPLHGKLEALEPIRLAMPGQPDAIEGSKVAATAVHGTRTQQLGTTPSLQLGAGHCGPASGQASAEGCLPMSGASSAAASTMDSSSHAMPSPLVSPDRVRATAVEAWMGAAAQHLGPSLVRVAVPGDASLSKEPRLLQRPSHESGDPVPSQSPAEMASTIQAGGPLLPVEVPVASQPAAPSQGNGATSSLGASVGQPSEPPRAPLRNPGGRRHSWSADDSPAYSHDKQAPASSTAPSAEEARSRSGSVRSSRHGLPSVAQRRDLPSGMRPPMSGGMAAHSMGYSVAPPGANSMQGSWQMPPVQLPSVNPDFIRELQHRMFLQQQQQQQRGFMPPSGEHRGPVRTRSLPKLTEHQGQQQAQWVQNGRIAAGPDHRSAANHLLRQSNGQAFQGAAHDSQHVGPLAKQPTVQHIEALSHQVSGPGRIRPDQAAPAPRLLHRQGFSLPTTPVAAHQTAQFPASSAAVMVKLSEGPAVWMGAADAMQLALAQQQQHSSKPSDVLLMPAVDAKRQRESGEASGTQQPPPPPPRSGTSTLQSQGSIQVPLPPPASLWGHQGPPITDVERFMSLSTPILGSRDYLDLKLSDVWSFYDEASIYGKEVFTMGGGRGPSLAYYVPSLSAMQLFLPVHPEAAHAHAASQVYRLSDSLTAKHPEWPRFMRPLAELFEGTKPYDRPALRERVEMLAESSADGLTGDRIMDQPLCQLHPASWMCVAWYPIYRIPDAPLTAKFLTYHSFTPVPTAATHYGARVLEAGQPAQHADSLLCLPTVGLKLCHLASEEWLDPVPAGASLTSAGMGRASSSCSSSGDNWSVSTDEEQAERERAFAMKAAAAGSWDGPYARRARLKMLSEGADRLSQREGLMAPSAVSKGRHDDYTFFVTRCEEDPLRL